MVVLKKTSVMSAVAMMLASTVRGSRMVQSGSMLAMCVADMMNALDVTINLTLVWSWTSAASVVVAMSVSTARVCRTVVRGMTCAVSVMAMGHLALTAAVSRMARPSQIAAMCAKGMTSVLAATMLPSLARRRTSVVCAVALMHVWTALACRTEAISLTVAMFVLAMTSAWIAREFLSVPPRWMCAGSVAVMV